MPFLQKNSLTMEGSQAASWDGTISHNLFHPFLPPKRCWTNIQYSDFQEKKQCHLAEIYRFYQIFYKFRFQESWILSLKQIFSFHFTIYFIFPSLDSPRCSNLGSFLWPRCFNNKTHGTTGVDATSVPRSFSAWLFVWCYFWSAKLASNPWKPSSLKDQLWNKSWTAKSGVNTECSTDKHSVAVNC